MNLNNIVLVVEGKTDKDFLSTFLNCEIVITNGTSVPCETITYLKTASKEKIIVVLTDPDYPGISIRNLIEKEIPNVQHAYVRKEVSIKKNKVGVAESTKEEVLNALKMVKSSKSEIKGNYTMSDLHLYHLTGCPDSFKKRKILSEALGLGFNNAKTLLRKLNLYNIKREKIEEILCRK